VASIGSPPVRLEPRPRGRTRLRALSRAKAALFRGRIDAELARGADPEGDPALARRARQLTRARYRRRLAASVDRLVAEIDSDPSGYRSSAVPVRRDQVAEARGTLVAIAGALRDLDSVNPQGVALTLRLITDPASPLYSGSAHALRREAGEALERLLAESHPWCELPAAPPIPGPEGRR
jgi:hypothetical protein